MKTAISIGDDIFNKAEHFARKKKKSRSELYTDAIAEYLARHDADAVTEAMDQTLQKVGRVIDPFIQEVGRRTLKRNNW
jgi:predicted transcriptional regulator